MLSSLPFEWFILLLRLLFVFLLYFFIFQVIRVMLREMQVFAAGEHEERDESDLSGHLLVKDAGDSQLRHGQRIPLEPVTVIGRHPRATIVLDHAFVSSEHAQLSWSDGRWWITDLDSTNGTILNGRDVTIPTGLRFGDVVEIGEISLQLVP
ncbi:MAG: FHA domain-containing protein [Sphaerobacteraceae bacterium]|nr:MAG: FHA domain-containing protein [Sphaerobacteraceae bacterium]